MATAKSFLKVALQYPDELPPIVREELEQLVASLQQSGRTQLPAESVPTTDLRFDASQIVSGQVPPARGGTGVDAAGVLDGQLLIGNNALNRFVLAALTAEMGITITNGPGSITLTLNMATVAARAMVGL